jgi:hypothetical protein
MNSCEVRFIYVAAVVALEYWRKLYIHIVARIDVAIAISGVT